LGALPGFTGSIAHSINDRGQAVGESEVIALTPVPESSTWGESEVIALTPVPESSTWAMMLLGFAGLALAGYRRAKAGQAILARQVG
jgi:hypothetical protein